MRVSFSRNTQNNKVVLRNQIDKIRLLFRKDRESYFVFTEFSASFHVTSRSISRLCCINHLMRSEKGRPSTTNGWNSWASTAFSPPPAAPTVLALRRPASPDTLWTAAANRCIRSWRYRMSRTIWAGMELKSYPPTPMCWTTTRPHLSRRRQRGLKHHRRLRQLDSRLAICRLPGLRQAHALPGPDPVGYSAGKHGRNSLHRNFVPTAAWPP